MKLATLALSISLALSTTAHANVKAGDHFVELEAKTAAGKNFRLKDMAGKWVLYTFGASWCAPCHKELLAYDALAPKFKGKLLFVSVNINNKAEDGKKFVASLALKHVFPVFMPDETSKAIKSYDPDKMPSTFVIDPKGVIQEIRYGYDSGDEDKLAATLSSLVK